jgi:hypothetical protein
MKYDLILVVGGKNFGSPSKLTNWLEEIQKACPGAEVKFVEWNCKEFGDIIFGKKRILIIAHSFGGFSTYLLTQEISSENDKYVDDAPLDVQVHVVTFDPVRWNTEDDVHKLTGFDEDGLAQVFDQTPFDMRILSAVSSWINYFVPGGLVSSTISPTNGETFANIEVDGTSHDGVIELRMPETLARIAAQTAD